MGFFSKPKKPKPPPMPQYNEMGREFQEEVYNRVEGALGGGGYFPGIRGVNLASALRSLGTQWRDMKADLPGRLNRLAPAGDTKVRSHIRGELDRDYYRARAELKSEAEDIPVRERSSAIAQGLDLLAGEKQMGASIANMYNQWLMSEAGAPTFESELMSGLGGAAGWMMGSGMATKTPAQTYGSMMSNPTMPTQTFFNAGRNPTSLGPRFGPSGMVDPY
jgi:hypothetical protein